MHCSANSSRPQIDVNVEREVLNHKTLVHPNIVQFREVFLTDTHLGVALEYAAGGELFEAVAKAGKLPEIEVRQDCALPVHAAVSSSVRTARWL